VERSERVIRMERRPEGGALPTISVIVPTYNRASYLPDALDGVLPQLGPDDEIVVVDDGSTDDTPTVLAGYGDRVRVIRTANGGLGAARNVGLAAARNDWIAFHDSDDVVRADRLAVQRAWIRRRPDLDAVLCNGEHMDQPDAFVVPRPLARALGGRLIGVRELFDGFPLYFQGALVRRRSFRLAGDFDATLRVHTDLDYGYRLLRVARALFVDRPVFAYRWHGENITADRLAGREDIASILERLLAGPPEVAAAIGRRRLRVRLARHHFRLARRLVASGRFEAALAALARARSLHPLHPRYRLMRIARVTSTASV
jgi:glycosyltransferase involved in cell wall biosynthesis